MGIHRETTTRFVAALLAGLLLTGMVSVRRARGESGDAKATPEAAAQPCFSGVYPHLAVTNGGKDEAGIGALVPWADRLWLLTYPAHVFAGGDDKLYQIDGQLHLTIRPESVGGTHADRMIHRESNQLIIGPYFIDAQGTVRVVSPKLMPGRLTAVARHLTDPANKVYFATMEQGFYEVDVHSLAVKVLHKDRNVGGKNFLPGVHGKGCYTGQGRLVFANNGEGGVLAEWDGSGNLGSSGAWKIVDRNKYAEVTGPGGIYGSPKESSPLWALGWDARSVLLNVRDHGGWTRFRLPKASYTQDANHGWYTEWPRIREVDRGPLLMNMHDMFYSFPRTFRPGDTAGIRPLSTFLKMVVDYASWQGRLVMGNDDATRQENPILGCPQSNLWFGRLKDLSSFGPAAGWGGPWVHDAVKANQPSEPFLLAGFPNRVVHLAQEGTSETTFALEIDARGDGKWTPYASILVPAMGYAYRVIPADVEGEWIRVKTDRDVPSATAYFHYSSGLRLAEPSIFQSLPAAKETTRRCEGLLHAGTGDAMPLTLASTTIDESGKAVETGYYVMGEDLRLHRTADSRAEKTLRQTWGTRQEFEEDAASIIVKDAHGHRYRLPKGPEVFSKPSAAGWPRGVREVVTERNLMNLQGTFYEIPRETSGGLAKIRPITTHNRRIFDFISWRGLLVLSGNRLGGAADGHEVVSDDGQAALWLGNIEDLWKFGPPRGEGGPWCKTAVQADRPSAPYLMTGYENKTVRLSHDGPKAVRFTIEVDFLADGTWQTYQTFTIPAAKR